MARLNILRGAALLILFAVVSFIASAMTGESVEVTAMATLPFLGLSGFLMDKEDDHGGGGGDPDAEKILRKIQETRDATETLSKNFGSLDKEAKELAEEQAKIAKNFDGLTADVKAFQNVIAKMEAKIRNERRSNGMSAIQRIQGDTELRNTVNNIARAAYMMARHKSLAGASEELLAAHKMMQGLSGKTVTSGSEPGSTYINDALIPELYSLVAEYGIWSGFDVIRAGTKTTKLLVRGADPVMSVVDEGVAPDEATVAGTSVSSTVKKMLGWVGVANEMLEDAETDVSGILLEAFANATAYRLDWFCTQADGGADATDGGMTGIFGGGGTAAVAASGNVSIATHDFEDWIKPMTVVDAMVLTRGGARWWIHPTLLAKVLGVKDANGRSIFLPSTEAPSFGAFGSIFGFPIQLAHAAPSADTTSSKIAVFGDPRGQAVLLRKDMEFVSSDQAKFLEDETVFRCRARGATKIRKATAFGVLTNAAS
jgi:HK97 family phage major capsid protein